MHIWIGWPHQGGRGAETKIRKKCEVQSSRHVIVKLEKDIRE